MKSKQKVWCNLTVQQMNVCQGSYVSINKQLADIHFEKYIIYACKESEYSENTIHNYWQNMVILTVMKK